MSLPDDLAATTRRYAAHNDEVEASQRRERGSIPPAPARALQVDLPLTAERAREIARFLSESNAVLTAAQLRGFSVAEIGTFCRARVTA